MPERRNIIVVTNEEHLYRGLESLLKKYEYPSELRELTDESIYPKTNSLEWYVFWAQNAQDNKALQLAGRAVSTGARVGLLALDEHPRTSILAGENGIHHCSPAEQRYELIRWLKSSSHIGYWERARLNAKAVTAASMY